MKTKILKLLREQGEYLSGQEICGKLAVSRTAVWKAVGQLKEEGYVIEAVQNKGYYLAGTPDLVTKEEVGSRLETQWAGHPTVFLPETDSTNNEAKRLAEAGASHGTLVVAEFQEAGKGRRGRSWVSQSGTGIWMTILLRPQFPPSQASMLTLLAAMAVADGIEEVTGLRAAIKWPNDIVFRGKKICGILTEMSAEPDYINHVVVGIGINANIREFPEELGEKATSLFLEQGKSVNRAAVIAAVWKAFERHYDQFLKTADLSVLRDKYEERLINKGEEVCVLDPKGNWKGVAHGIDERGRLLVEVEKQVRAVDSGEVSVRGGYGYV